jgi:hypothetical protein
VPSTWRYFGLCVWGFLLMVGETTMRLPERWKTSLSVHYSNEQTRNGLPRTRLLLLKLCL